MTPLPLPLIPVLQLLRTSRQKKLPPTICSRKSLIRMIRRRSPLPMKNPPAQKQQDLLEKRNVRQEKSRKKRKEEKQQVEKQQVEKQQSSEITALRRFDDPCKY